MTALQKSASQLNLFLHNVQTAESVLIKIITKLYVRAEFRQFNALRPIKEYKLGCVGRTSLRASTVIQDLSGLTLSELNHMLLITLKPSLHYTYEHAFNHKCTTVVKHGFV